MKHYVGGFLPQPPPGAWAPPEAWTEHPILGELYEGGGFAGGTVHILRCIGRLPGRNIFYVLRTEYRVAPRRGWLVDLDAVPPDGDEPRPVTRHLQPCQFAGPMRDYRHVPGVEWERTSHMRLG